MNYYCRDMVLKVKALNPNDSISQFNGRLAGKTGRTQTQRGKEAGWFINKTKKKVQTMQVKEQVTGKNW